MYEITDRLYHPNMAYYRETYRNSERWNYSEALEGKRVIVYGEQGNGDNIQFARYLAPLKSRGCHVTLHAPECLRTLLSPLVDFYLDKDDPNLPPHDYNIPSMSLPFALNQTEADSPYIFVEKGESPDDWGGKRIGIAWEGNPEHSNAGQRNCPLRFFNSLQAQGRIYSLQPYIHDPDLLSGAEEFELYGIALDDYLSTAQFMRHLDYVVTVDTSVLHLAGALGVKTYGLLSSPADCRWDVHRWYSSVKIIRQESPGDWPVVFAELEWLLNS